MINEGGGWKVIKFKITRWQGEQRGEKRRKNTHCGTAGLEDTHVGCCSRSPASAAASPGCAVHQRQTEREGG